MFVSLKPVKNAGWLRVGQGWQGLLDSIGGLRDPSYELG